MLRAVIASTQQQRKRRQKCKVGIGRAQLTVVEYRRHAGVAAELGLASPLRRESRVGRRGLFARAGRYYIAQPSAIFICLLPKFSFTSFQLTSTVNKERGLILPTGLCARLTFHAVGFGR